MSRISTAVPTRFQSTFEQVAYVVKHWDRILNFLKAQRDFQKLDDKICLDEDSKQVCVQLNQSLGCPGLSDVGLVTMGSVAREIRPYH